MMTGGSGHCSKDETIAFAKKLQKWAFRLMIDFHYSDSWQILTNNTNQKFGKI